MTKIQNSKPINVFLNQIGSDVSIIGYWDLEFIWNLNFVIWNFIRHSLHKKNSWTPGAVLCATKLFE
jgi:hypothetical protein